MAKSNRRRRGSDDDVIIVSRDDWDGKKKKYPKAPGGKYRARFGKKSVIKPNAKGDGNVLNLITTLTAMHNGKRTKHKGVNVFDNIAPHVGWKIAQVLRAMGVKKPPKKMTLKELLAMIKKYSKEIRVVVGIDRYRGEKKNNILQYLPLKASKSESDDDIEDDDDDDVDDEEDSEDDDEDSDDEDSDDDEDDESEDDEDEDDEDDDDDIDEDDDDDDDEDEDDEDDRPARRRKRKTRR